MNNNGNKFVDLNTVHNNLLELKKIISTNYSSFNFNIFKDFSRNTSESISLNSPIKYILDNMKKNIGKINILPLYLMERQIYLKKK